MPFFRIHEKLGIVSENEETEITIRCKRTENGFSNELFINGEEVHGIVSVGLDLSANELPTILIERNI